MSAISDLSITVIQTDLLWEDRNANLASLTSQLEQLSSESDIIVLPEMFSTGFSMNPSKLAEPHLGPTYQWMVKMASKLDTVIAGSIISYMDEAGIRSYYNRLYWVEPGGNHACYDKRHLFSFAGEHDHYSAGNERLIVAYKGWKICPLICYDLRFPVWSRNNSHDGAETEAAFDLLIYVANWPEARRKPWINLLEARAHENQAYVVGVNRIGKDGNGITHSGDSGVFSPKGERLDHIQPHEPKAETVTLSRSDLDEFRSKFTVWKDKDAFKLNS